MEHATNSIPPHALLRWRVRTARISRNGLPASPLMRLHVVFLPVWRVLSTGGRVHDDGRLKQFLLFSLLHTKVQERPPVFFIFQFSPCTFNFVYGLDFGYISFDLVRLSPSIEIN